ncbi:MAG: DUF4340 domain-containing protein [bacterium]
MLSRKSLVGLAVLLVVLVLLSWATSSRYRPVEGGGFVDVLPAGADPGSAQTIRAWLGSMPDSAVVLTRQGEGWVLPSRWNWPAKTDLVTRLLDDLKGLSGEKRAASKDVLTDFQCDDENGLHVVAQGPGGSELFHLIAGKAAARGGTFVRVAGQDDVYLTSASLRTSFGMFGDEPKAPDAKRWIDLNVCKTDRNEVDRLEIESGGSSLVLEKEFAAAAAPDSADGATAPAVDRSQWTWKPDSAGEFDKGKVDGMLGTLTNLYASEAADPANLADYGLGDDARTATLFLHDGTSRVIRFGNSLPEEKKTYVRVGDSGLPALVFDNTVERIFAARKDLSPTKK